jgi:hypothetical protein
MIPKKIHYCWLSGKDLPPNTQMCIDSWKNILPDYEIVLWDRNRFDINSVAFVAEAVNAKKWAFASDYIRLYALHTEGGIYLDSDVFVKKNFDQFLENDFFSALLYHDNYVKKGNTLLLLNEDGTSKIPFTRKPGFGIQAAVIGSINGHPYLEDCMEFYRERHFIKVDGTFYSEIIAPDIFAMFAEKYGFRYKNELQHLENNMLILPSHIFAGNLDEATENSYTVHLCEGSWNEEDSELRIRFKKIFGKMKIYEKIIGFLKKPIRKLAYYRKSQQIRKKLFRKKNL